MEQKHRAAESALLVAVSMWGRLADAETPSRKLAPAFSNRGAGSSW